MEKLRKIKKPEIGSQAELPFIEKFVYLASYIYFLGMAVHKIYLYPLENPSGLYSEDFADGWKFLGRKRDNSDFEWQFWTAQAVNLIIASSLHSIGNRLVSWLYPQHRMAYFALFQLCFLAISISWKPTMVFVAHNMLYYLAARTKSTKFCWFIGLVMLTSFTSVETLVNIQFYTFNRNPSEGDFVLFTSLMCQLRGMSFCLESCLATNKQDSDDEIKYGFIDLLGYNFYLPLFCNGPVVLYNDFYKQVNQPPKPLSMQLLTSFAWDGVRSLFWYFVMEIGFHYLYISSLCKDAYLIENTPVMLSTGLLYTLILLFSVKYVIFYRVAGMYARLDGISPADIPKCVWNIYLFSIMWKTFDKGLHHWLIRYIYFPLGGSRNGLFKQILSSIATFSYVYYWHGAYKYLFYWACLQWLGVFVEAMTGQLLKTETLKHIEYNILSPAATRRLHAVFGVITIMAAILSNCVFLVSHESVIAYLKAVFIKGGLRTSFGLAIVAYCLVQIIMEVELRTKVHLKAQVKME